MQFDIITIFPNLFNSFLNESLIKKSLDKKLNKICVHDLRKWAKDKHKQVDDRPYGGGAGMVLMAEPIIKAVIEIKKKNKGKKTKVVLLTPGGQQFTERTAKKLSQVEHLILICGRYEGFDARIDKIIDEKISIGPYILSGGELPAMVVIEAVARLIPGFLSNPQSLQDETQVQKNKKNIQYPQYTRPEILKIKNRKYSVPKILLSGDHQRIEEWRKNHRQQKKT